jgi:hypothetical protein
MDWLAVATFFIGILVGGLGMSLAAINNTPNPEPKDSVIRQ